MSIKLQVYLQYRQKSLSSDSETVGLLGASEEHLSRKNVSEAAYNVELTGKSKAKRETF